MQPDEWVPPPVVAASTAVVPRRRGLVIGAGLLGAGVVAGAIIGGTVLSGAATTASPTPPAACSAASGGHGPGLSGTVTAVGASSVTIKTSAGTTTYKVDSNSDIDKNGEAQLSSLKAGDAVRFSVTSTNVIDKLHAGDEALNRPQGDSHGPGRGLGLSG